MNWSLFQCFVTVIFACLAFKLVDMSDKPRRGWAKALTATGLVLVFFMAGISVDRGWPSRNSLPNEFIFIHAVVQKDTQNIVVLIRTKENPAVPYSVVLPYTEELGITLELANLQTLLEGEIPVSYKEGSGYTFHIHPKPTEETKEQPARGGINTPKFREA